MKNRKGFTLIEILIVIVILAVLATIVLPRMLAQPENALVAEANQQLGALARAQDNYKQLTGSATGITPINWATLGLQNPGATRFTYACTGTTCTATRVGGTGGTITIDYSVNPHTFACTAPYVGNATDATRGCTKL